MKALQLLADGEWHNFERIMGQLIRLVPPGQAYRRGEEQRINGGGAQRPNERPERVIPRTSDEIIRFGARSIVHDILRYMPVEIVPRGKVPRGTDKRIRLIQEEEKQDDSLSRDRFSERQLVILELLGEGLSLEEIDQRLGFRSGGARDTTTVLFRKLGVSHQPALIHRARQLGLIPLRPLTPREGELLELLLRHKYHALAVARRQDWSDEEYDRARRMVLAQYGVEKIPALREVIPEH